MPVAREIEWRRSPERDWWVAAGAPAEALRPYARRYQGYYEFTEGPAQRRHSPGGNIPIIFAMASPMRVGPGVDSDALEEHRSFVGGPQDAFAYSESAGEAHGVQVDLTPVGAYLFLGVPLDSIAGRS